MASKAKKIAALKSHYFKYCDMLVRSGMKDAVAAQKLINHRQIAAHIVEDRDLFELELLIEWNLPEKFFEALQGIVDAAKKRAEMRESIRQIIDSYISQLDYAKAVQWFENANNINTWKDFDNLNQAFLMLKRLTKYTKFGQEYMTELHIDIIESVWNDRGVFAKWETIKVTPSNGEDYSIEMIDKWSECYHELIRQAYNLFLFAKSHHEYIALPQYILDEGYEMSREENN